MRIDHRLIVALDVTDPNRAVELAASVRPHADAVKVGWPLVLAGGLDVLRRLAKSGYVLCDFKIADIPNTNRLIVEQAVDAGASGIICHGFVGEDSVRACIDASGGKDVFVVVEMSHPGGVEYTAKHAEDLARLATRANATGIIAPATRPQRVRALRAIIGQKQILAPGVGAQGGKASEAIVAGADAVIVGRAIYEAKDPAKATLEIADEIRSSLPPRASLSSERRK
ncbi:MAG TPA: orotidine-5'-phosphate decarboxylase [Thermoplasmata archaeon]|nr:orotidine-5'-phosphate decarboxylase [Thermoplasmata archaeon]